MKNNQNNMKNCNHPNCTTKLSMNAPNTCGEHEKKGHRSSCSHYKAGGYGTCDCKPFIPLPEEPCMTNHPTSSYSSDCKKCQRMRKEVNDSSSLPKHKEGCPALGCMDASCKEDHCTCSLPKHDMGLEEKIEEICRDNDVWWFDDGKWNVTNNIDFVDAMKSLLHSEKEKTLSQLEEIIEGMENEKYLINIKNCDTSWVHLPLLKDLLTTITNLRKNNG